MNQKKVTNFSVTADAAETMCTTFVELYFVIYLFIASWELYKSYRQCLNSYISDGGTNMEHHGWF